MKLPFPTITMIAALALAGTVEAQGIGGGMGAGSQMQQRIATIDENGDGVVQRAEVLAWRDTVLAAMDANSDGTLAREEYMGLQLGPGADPANRGPRYDQQQAAKAAAFAAMDSDGDGRVPGPDFLAHAGAAFDKADADRNGVLSPMEFRAMRQLH